MLKVRNFNQLKNLIRIKNLGKYQILCYRIQLKVQCTFKIEYKESAL